MPVSARCTPAVRAVPTIPPARPVALRPHPPSALPHRLLALLLGALLLVASGCARLPHEPGQAHRAALTASGDQSATRPAAGQTPHAGAPADSCSPSPPGSDLAGQPQPRSSPTVLAAHKKAAGPAVSAGHARGTPSPVPGAASGRRILCSLCRWRT
ncbi:hypothetical protein [Streptomyces sp. PR69]|uniref:hypothetical protein n=1 Tax=Streptomyces sp. PR69 TaxID=2984950 RepID=UPI0022641BCE|nr:hypothetical protein [Streptomyces sp. PR69]